ncbi:hypothetical protein F383_38156 [Gossypium arboreum]|uniref:Uncharacterized protein n=1 Tax=Gossypium arboreum TaxID=29729 RepID=A0A0B0MJL7_GOSAR|nr:hypothetical protein F383_38156 [Gossypium arboreum]
MPLSQTGSYTESNTIPTSQTWSYTQIISRCQRPRRGFTR